MRVFFRNARPAERLYPFLPRPGTDMRAPEPSCREESRESGRGHQGSLDMWEEIMVPKSATVATIVMNAATPIATFMAKNHVILSSCSGVSFI